MSRRWFHYSPSALGNVSILYRVDNLTDSELWLYEGGLKKLLGTYPVVNYPFSSSLLATHLAGTRDMSAATYDRVVAAPKDEDDGGIHPYRLFGRAIIDGDSGSQTDLTTWQDTAGSATRTATGNESSTLADGTHTITGAALSTSWTNESQSENPDFDTDSLTTIREYYALPGGTMEFNATLSINVTGVSLPLDVVSSASLSASFLSGSRNEGSPDNNTSLQVTGTANTSINYSDSGPLPVTVGLTRRTAPGFLFTASSQIRRPGSGSSEALHTTSGTGTITPTLNSLRPTAYLSKTDTTRYVGLHYLAADQTFKTDYYVIDSGLNFTKTTWDYTTPPAPNSNDQQRSFLTLSYNDFLFADSNPYWARQHYALTPNTTESANFQNTYNIEADGTVTAFDSFANSSSNPGLTGIIANSISEADRILWVAALPSEAAQVEVATGYTVTQYTPK